jgi:hypothetical protein
VLGKVKPGQIVRDILSGMQVEVKEDLQDKFSGKVIRADKNGIWKRGFFFFAWSKESFVYESEENQIRSLPAKWGAIQFKAGNLIPYCIFAIASNQLIDMRGLPDEIPFYIYEEHSKYYILSNPELLALAMYRNFVYFFVSKGDL